MANRILVDTGFWYAVFDKPSYEIVAPFPTMYELLRTKFVKNKGALEEIKQMFQSGRITRFDDDVYRSGG